MASKVMPEDIERLVVLDLETTGLVPAVDEVLQLGMVHVDLIHEEVVDTFDRTVHLDPRAAQDLDPVVRRLHESTGLLARCEAETATLRDVEHAAIAWLADHGLVAPVVLAGGGVDRFDRGFLEVHMPSLLAHFHYWALDASTVVRSLRTLKVPLPDFVYPELVPHLAVDDCLQSWFELRDLGRFLRAATAELPFELMP